MILLFVGAVLDQQLTRAEGVGHAHADHQHLVGRQLLQHRCLRLGREVQATVFLGNDHAEEFLFLEELPQFRRQISTFNGQVPGVAHGNSLGALVVNKGLLFLRQARVAVDQQAVPVGAPGKQLAIPTDGPRFQGHFFGIGHLGSHFLEHGEYPRGQPAPAKSRQACSGGNGGADKQYEREQSRRQK